uniref:Uncharacterized protein n=1 Tax=Triticum urartu TaxID=4572 RepID=A0A8R7V833_TRIUA
MSSNWTGQVTLSLPREKWRNALLVSEVVAGVHLPLGDGESLEVASEVTLTPHLAAVVARDTADHRVLPDVQVPVVHVRAPRALANERLHEVVQTADPVRPVRAVARPERDVLDVVEHAAPVRVWRVRIGDAADPSAVRLQDHEPRGGAVEPGEDLVPRVLCDGLLDVVGLVLGERAQAGRPVEERLHRRLDVAGVDVDRGLQPAHLPAVGARHAELREQAAHRAHQRAAAAEIQGLEEGLLVLHDHPYAEVLGEGRRERLPFGHGAGRALVNGLLDVGERHRRRDRYQPDLPRQHDAEVPAAAAADGPEEVAPHGLLVQEPPVGVDQRGVEDVVDGEAVLAHHHAHAAAAEVAAQAHGRAHAGREREPGRRLRDGVVQLPDRRARVHPRGGRDAVDAHGAEVGEVDHREHLGALGPVREPLVVVPAAAHADAHVVAAAAEHRGLDVGRVGGRHDAERPHRGRGEELGVPDRRHQDRSERRRARREHALAGDARREALEEVAGGSQGRGEHAATEDAKGEQECHACGNRHCCRSRTKWHRA